MCINCLLMCRVLSPVRCILSAMPAYKRIFTKTFSQILAVIKRMASPEGVTISGLSQSLSLTRRSVFRLLKTIEQEFHIPVIMKKSFGGSATYSIPQSFIDDLSKITATPTELSFEEALIVYIVTHSKKFEK